MDRECFPLRKHLVSWALLSLSLPPPGMREWTKARGGQLAHLLLQLVLREPGTLLEKRAMSSAATDRSASESLPTYSTNTSTPAIHWRENLASPSRTKDFEDEKSDEHRGALTCRTCTEKFITKLEKTYLLTSFDSQLDFERHKTEEDQKMVLTEKCQVIPDLVSYLTTTLQTIIRGHVSFAEIHVSFCC